MAKWLTRLPLDRKVRGVRSLAATLCAAVLEVAQTVTYKLMKFIFAVYHPSITGETLN